MILVPLYELEPGVGFVRQQTGLVTHCLPAFTILLVRGPGILLAILRLKAHCKLVFDASKRSAEDRTHTVLRYRTFSASQKVYGAIWSHAPSGLEAMSAVGMSVNGRVGIVRNVEFKAHRGLC